jgi:hypothetical protein
MKQVFLKQLTLAQCQLSLDTLSQEAADYLISLDGFHLYGISWKSSDFNPGRPERPIHNTLFKKPGI